MTCKSGRVISQCHPSGRCWRGIRKSRSAQAQQCRDQPAPWRTVGDSLGLGTQTRAGRYRRDSPQTRGCRIAWPCGTL